MESSVSQTMSSTITTQTPSTTRIQTTMTTSKTSDECILASSLSAVCTILFFTIFGVIFYLYRRKIKSTPAQTLLTVPQLPKKSSPRIPNSDFHRNEGFQSDLGYSVPPKREEPLPRKTGGKVETLTPSPYHRTLGSEEDYCTPPKRNESFVEPPLPPNLARKLKQSSENEPARPMSASGNSYYLDMDAVKDDLYQNVTEENIYINH